MRTGTTRPGGRPWPVAGDPAQSDPIRPNPTESNQIKVNEKTLEPGLHQRCRPANRVYACDLVITDRRQNVRRTRDPYSFLPTLSETDLDLFGKGDERRPCFRQCFEEVPTGGNRFETKEEAATWRSTPRPADEVSAGGRPAGSQAALSRFRVSRAFHAGGDFFKVRLGPNRVLLAIHNV